MRESTVEQHLVKRVKALGGEVRKVQWIGRRGAPDRIVMLPAYSDLPRGDRITALEVREAMGAALTGRLHTPMSAWVELKRPGEVAEPHQAREHERMRKMGQRVVVLDSIEAVDKFLEGVA
jgi:hypothetical protein